MRIETKFDIGDIVYVPMAPEGRVECPLCLGEKILILADQRRIYCSECYGDGYVLAIPIYKVYSFRIAEISIWVIHKDRVVARYQLSETGDPGGRWGAAPHETHIKEDGHIYGTREEAQRQAARLQKEAEGVTYTSRVLVEAEGD